MTFYQWLTRRKLKAHHERRAVTPPAPVPTTERDLSDSERSAKWTIEEALVQQELGREARARWAQADKDMQVLLDRVYDPERMAQDVLARVRTQLVGLANELDTFEAEIRRTNERGRRD